MVEKRANDSVDQLVFVLVEKRVDLLVEKMEDKLVAKTVVMLAILLSVFELVQMKEQYLESDSVLSSG